MRKRFSMLVVLTVAITGFFALTTASPSFAASQANKTGVTFALSGQYLGIGEWAQNQAQAFSNNAAIGTANQNTFQAFIQRLRLNSSVSYDKLAHGMPLAAIFVQMDLTNGYNGITNGYGTNGYYMLGGTPAPTGFNNDFNTFGIRQAYIRVITPIGAIMFGRMPVKFGLGVAVNTNADGLGDFLPLGNFGVFAGTLFGSEVSAYNTNACNTSTLNVTLPSSNCALPGTTEGYYPPATAGYTHIQMGTIPTIEVMTMKPVNDMSYSAWLTEAHLNQFEAGISSVTTAYTGSSNTAYSTLSSIGSIQPTANITFGGLSAQYAANGTKLAVEGDYFRGSLVDSSQAITAGFTVPELLYGAVGMETVAGVNGGNPIFNLGYYNAVSDQNVDISSYDLYATASQVLSTSIPMSIGLKFGIGAPVASDNYNFTYYSTVQNTRTLFGDVIGSSWQPIQFSAPGISYIYGGAAGEAVGPNLANKYVIMVDAKQYLTSGNTLKESLMHAAWLTTSINDPMAGGNLQLFGGSNIGTEFDLNFTHHFTKTLVLEAWASYVWTGAGVESATTNYQSTGQSLPPSMGSLPIYTEYSSFSNAQTKNITALGTDISWNF